MYFCGNSVRQTDRFCTKCGNELAVFDQVSARHGGTQSVISKVLNASSKVKRQVLGVCEKRYAFPIDAEDLIGKLSSSFENLGYSVSSIRLPIKQFDSREPEHDDQEIVSYVVEIRKVRAALS